MRQGAQPALALTPLAPATQGPLPSLDYSPLPRADLLQALLEVVKHPEGIWVCICIFCPGRVSARNTTKHWPCEAGRAARASKENTSVGLVVPTNTTSRDPKPWRDAFGDSSTPHLTGLPLLTTHSPQNCQSRPRLLGKSKLQDASPRQDEACSPCYQRSGGSSLGAR